MAILPSMHPDFVQVEKRNGPTREESHAPTDDIRLLTVAFNRAFQRRLSDIPSPSDVDKAVNKLAHDGAKPSAFVRHAARVQEQLARLNAQLQKAQEQQQDHAISPVQDTPTMPSVVPRKRSAGDNDDSTPLAQEMKRIRLDSTVPLPPRPHTPPSTPYTKASPEPKAPPESIALKSTLAASQTLRRSKPRADFVRSQASVDDSHSGLSTVANGPLASSNDTMSDSKRKIKGLSSSNDAVEDGNHQRTKSEVTRPSGPVPVDPPSAKTHAQDKLGKMPLPSISTDIPEAQMSPLSTVASPATTGTRQQAASSAGAKPFVVNVPGIWAIQVGKPSAGQTDVPFVVDPDTANSVHRWATHKRGFDPDARHVVVHLVALQTTAVSAAQHNLSQSPGGMTPQAFALALRDLQPQWPDDDSLVLQLNAGQPEERTWFLSEMSSGMPLDVSDAICEGKNSLRILQFKNMADIVFVMYAAPPTPETIAAALEWERIRKLYSFQQPSGWSLK